VRIVTGRALFSDASVRADSVNGLAVVAAETKAVGLGQEEIAILGAVGVVTGCAAAGRKWAMDVFLVYLELMASEAKLLARHHERIRGRGFVTGTAQFRRVRAVLPEPNLSGWDATCGDRGLLSFGFSDHLGGRHTIEEE
jgi:hypothetical protein